MRKTILLILFLLWCARAAFSQEVITGNPEEMIGEWEFIPTGIILDSHRPVFVPFDYLSESDREFFLVQVVLNISFIDTNFIRLTIGNEREIVGIYSLTGEKQYSYGQPRYPYVVPFYEEAIHNLIVMTAEQESLSLSFRQDIYGEGELEMFQTVELLTNERTSSLKYDHKTATLVGLFSNVEGRKVKLYELLPIDL